MVGIAIGLALVSVMVVGYANTSGNLSVNSLVSEYQTNGRYALETLKREVRHAALSPLLWDAAQLNINGTAETANFGCGAGVVTKIREGLRASNDSNPFATTCVSARNGVAYSQGDVLTLRRAGMETTSNFARGAPFIRLGYGAGHVFLGGESPASMTPPTFDYPLVNDIYFINRFTTSVNESPRVPALFRLRLSNTPNPTMVPELVASNVEHMQWQFGVADASGNLRYVSPQAVTDWATVVSARVWLLLRASTPEKGFENVTYNMGDFNFQPLDSFRRMVLSSTIQLRNQ
jgi:type IV pilus assembly protein PilW